MLRHVHVAINHNSDHVATFTILSYLIAVFWPVGLLRFVMEYVSIKSGDEPEEEHYIFYGARNDRETEDKDE